MDVQALSAERPSRRTGNRLNVRVQAGWGKERRDENEGFRAAMIQLRWMTPATQYLPGSLECQESCGSGRLDRAVGIARIALLPCLLVLISLPAPASDRITGTVRNQTSGLPAAGDKIVLLRIDHGVIEEAQTTTDGQGSFSLAVQFPDKPHAVRAIYKSVVYDQRVTSDAPLAIAVFDSA